jgi:hypothetical protein
MDAIIPNPGAKRGNGRGSDISRRGTDVSRALIDISRTPTDIIHALTHISRTANDANHAAINISQPSSDASHALTDASRTSSDISPASIDVSQRAIFQGKRLIYWGFAMKWMSPTPAHRLASGRFQENIRKYAKWTVFGMGGRLAVNWRGIQGQDAKVPGRQLPSSILHHRVDGCAFRS